MAQQKIQLEVGSNLPPLKSDLIVEKKRELEEYQEFKKLKQKFREEKRFMKMQDKLGRRGNKSASPCKNDYTEEKSIEISCFEDQHEEQPMA